MAAAVSPPSPDCFVIMPFGLTETERVWIDAYEPTIKSCSLNPIRVDKEDDGSLITAQIVQYLQRAPLLIADLTFARPNCYYEVGYAHGLARERNLILCCREDHITGSPNFRPAQNKVHFDLQNYGILFWDPTDLNRFKQGLRSKIEKRIESLNRDAVAKREAADAAVAAPVTNAADNVRAVLADQAAQARHAMQAVSTGVGEELDDKLKRLTDREERRAATWKRQS